MKSSPNVIGEGIANGVPTVTTDAGDCDDILGNPARVAGCRDAVMLAEKILSLLALDPAEQVVIGLRYCESIISGHSIE